MEMKEYYQAFMSIIEYVNEGHQEIKCEKGEELAGNYWARIYQVLGDKRVGNAISGGSFLVVSEEKLNPIYEDCKNSIKEIEKKESDRELDNRAKENGIKNSKYALIISIVALVISLASLAWQILKDVCTK